MSQQLLTKLEKQRVAPSALGPIAARLPQRRFPLPILQLQHLLGNRRVAQLVRAKRLTPQDKIISLQRKLTVGAEDNQYEQEADRVARQMMSMPDSISANSTQQDISAQKDKDKMLQTKPLAA